ncbi:hypothetical protein Runsl_3813 [Runella slithyformis DSM 19594]|uniref:Uncharacterized protein n=1 Tax=Runella slithyformis (strain ATCC 29530 / DSM 19594 / LMG 11500 / NCIMB 11436 / LSU 4) TaxID=761193 RepID=A0A7U4E710_RUNSL|nr:hypothetical protein Runsl_3813 [Runella slithyformis DSM 19594]
MHKVIHLFGKSMNDIFGFNFFQNSFTILYFFQKCHRIKNYLALNLSFKIKGIRL